MPFQEMFWGRQSYSHHISDLCLFEVLDFRDAKFGSWVAKRCGNKNISTSTSNSSKPNELPIKIQVPWTICGCFFLVDLFGPTRSEKLYCNSSWFGRPMEDVRKLLGKSWTDRTWSKLMEEILHHLTCIKTLLNNGINYCLYVYINWCRISSINRLWWFQMLLWFVVLCSA